MVNYKEILRLAAEGTSQRQIAAIKTGIEQKRDGGKDNCCRKSVMK